MAKNKIIGKLSLITILIVMSSCATSVPIKSVRKPTIDTSGIQRLAIKPFENASGVGGALGAQLPQYLTDLSTQTITNTGKFTPVAPTDPNAEGIFTGKITNITSKDTQESSTYKDDKGVEHTQITYYREVSLEFSYSVISTRTDMAIGTVMKKGSARSSDTDRNSLTDPTVMGKRIIDDQMRNLAHDLVPHIVSENRTLMKETSKDHKKWMREVEKLVKAENYEEAIRQYDEIGTIAAKNNAKILREAIASDTAATAQLNQLFEDTDGLAEKAIKNGSSAISAKLPAGSNITIMKTQSADRQRLDYAVDQMTKTLVQEGNFQVVDRSNQKLIQAEQQFQLSGEVDDDSIVSIGHQLGVKYIVLCWISGEKSLRRLNLKVLDVETAQIVDQSDFEI